MPFPDTKIPRVQGSVHLGHEMELVERVEQRSRSNPYSGISRPNDGSIPEIDYTPVMAPPGEMAMKRLQSSLKPVGKDVFLEDAGLCASYGIFGAPGSGKTHLLLYLLRQILHLHASDPDKKFGGLILDPKAVLIEDVRRFLRAIGREDDLVVINANDLTQSHQTVNPIDCSLDAFELGRFLVLAARSAGVAATEPFWFLTWSNLFGAALHLLRWLDNDVVTLKRLVDVLLLEHEEALDEQAYDLPLATRRGPDLQRRPGEPAKQRKEREIEYLIRVRAKPELARLSRDERQDAVLAISRIESFYRAGGNRDYVETIDAFISNAYGAFQQSRFRCFAPTVSKNKGVQRKTFNDSIIDEGKIVLVSASPGDPAMAKMLCTLVKCLFQQNVLSRKDRWRAGELENVERPLVLACDEYAAIASELPGESIGDGYFFSQAREFRCLGLLATQSVNVLEASSLKNAWRSVFSNFSAKIFLRLVDNETAKEAADLAGESGWYITKPGASRNPDGLSTNTQQDLQERRSLPTQVLTQVLTQGDAVVIGSLNGNIDTPRTRFVHVPSGD